MNDQVCTIGECIEFAGSKLRDFKADFMAQFEIELKRRGIVQELQSEGQE